jgi:hypothetical protein
LSLLSHATGKVCETQTLTRNRDSRIACASDDSIKTVVVCGRGRLSVVASVF